MIATWMERTLILTPEGEKDSASLNVLAAACDPKNWTHTPPQAKANGSGALTGEVPAPPPLDS